MTTSFESLLKHAPKIGEYWEGQGGIYAGLYQPRSAAPRIQIVSLTSVLRDQKWGARKLIEGATDKFDGRINTRAILEADPDNAIVKAITSLEVDGHKDFHWPATGELLHAYITVGDLILKAVGGSWVWSSTQRPGSADYAILTKFDDGYTPWYRKGCEYAALAVRSPDLSVIQ